MTFFLEFRLVPKLVSVMQSILRIKQRRSISRVVVIKSVAPIELAPHARCFATRCMTGLRFIVIPEQDF